MNNLIMAFKQGLVSINTIKINLTLTAYNNSFGDPYGHPSHCYKGKSLLFNHGDLEGESRLEMTGSSGSTSSIRIRTQTKKLKIKFCCDFMRSSYHFTLIYVVRTRSPKIPLS